MTKSDKITLGIFAAGTLATGLVSYIHSGRKIKKQKAYTDSRLKLIANSKQRLLNELYADTFSTETWWQMYRDEMAFLDIAMETKDL